MRFTSLLCPLLVAYAEEDATYLLQSQVLRAKEVQNQTAVPQYMKCPSFTRQNCPFNDIRRDYANSAGECCDKCHAESQCAGYVFNTKNECWLKRGCQVPRTGASDVISSGPIYRTNSNGNVCPSVSGMNCPFNDIRKDYANSASECCDKCHATSGCGGFVYNTKRECWLKNACDNPTWRAGDVIAAGPIQRTPPGWGVPPPTPPPPTPPPPPICSGAQPRCAGVACVNGQWMCGPPAMCSGAQPRCAGAACIDGQWMCAGSYCPGTDSPGGETDVTDAQCLDADRGFGPGFSCANTEMYCSSDSGDGLTVGQCCPSKCKTEFERKKKNSNSESKGKSEDERKAKRAGNEGSRKKNEKDRKKQRKDTEWNSKRDATETRNKNAEDERKSKRGWKEGQRKNERGWKQNKRQRQAAADQRERSRKETRNKNKKPVISKKDCSKNKRKYAKCKANKKCEKKFKAKGRKEPNC